MRIVVLHADFTETGGAEILLAAQARWLREAGHAVRVVALRDEDGGATALLGGIPCTVVGLPAGCRKVQYLRAPMLDDLAARVQPALRDADVVLAHNFPAAPLAASATGMRRVWYAHEPYRMFYPAETHPMTAARAARWGGDAPPDGATRQFARRQRRRVWRERLLGWRGDPLAPLRAWDAAQVARLDAIAANSAYTGGMVQAALHRAVDAVIPPMVSFGAAAPARRGLRREAPQLLATTRLGVPKNVDMLIRAMAVLRRAHPRALLHVVGDGPQRSALERLASDVAPGMVQFHGYVRGPDMDAIAAACDVFALVPADEPFGMVFAEAAARGLLLVGPDHGGPREILEDGALGATCDAFDPAAIADAIARTLALTDAEADARRAQADARCRARYAPDAVGRQLEGLLRG